MNKYIFIPVDSISGSEMKFVNRSTSKILDEVPVFIDENMIDEYLFEVTDENLKLVTIFDNYVWFSKEEVILLIEEE